MRIAGRRVEGVSTFVALSALGALALAAFSCAEAVTVDASSGSGGGGGEDSGGSAGAGATSGPGSGGGGAAGGSGGAGGAAGGGAGGGSGVCVPGSTEACYTGPAGTQDIGICKAGLRTCMPDASGFGPCEGDIVPELENCDAPGDEDCNGEINEASAGCGPSSCAGCTVSPVAACASDVVVVGHYEGGNREVCIGQGDGTPFMLALMSYETTAWKLSGAIGRVTEIQIYSLEAFGSITGNGNVPTSVQVAGSSPADPYSYAQSMGECPAHTGYAGAVFGVSQASVCHMEEGLQSACSYPNYTCLSISP